MADVNGHSCDVPIKVVKEVDELFESVGLSATEYSVFCAVMRIFFEFYGEIGNFIFFVFG